MADPAQDLLHIAESIEEIVEQYLQRSTIKRLLNLRSGTRRLKKNQEKLQKLLGVLRVASQVETRTVMNPVEDQLITLYEMHCRRTSQSSSAPQYTSSNVGSNNAALTQTVQGQVTPRSGLVIEHYSASRSATTYVRDNSVVVDGSGNNITMIICDSCRSD